LAACGDVATGNFNSAEATPYLDAHIYIHFSFLVFFMVCLLPQAVDRLSWSVVSNPPASSSRREPGLTSRSGDTIFESLA
jgi:hypothetical protein